MKIVLWVLASIALIVGIGFLVEGTDFLLYKTFAPKRAAVERQVFEQTKSYNDGMVQELQNMHLEYLKSKDPQEKAAIASIVLHRTANLDLDRIHDPDVVDFIRWCRDQARFQSQKGNQ